MSQMQSQHYMQTPQQQQSPMQMPQQRQSQMQSQQYMPQQQMKAYSGPIAAQQPADREHNCSADPWPVLGGLTSAELRAHGAGNQQFSAPEFDLGKDGAFSNFSVLFIAFYAQLYHEFCSNAMPALQKKGFKVTAMQMTQELAFIEALNSGKYDVAWVISGSPAFGGPARTPANEKLFTDALIAFHQKKKGLMIWGDNRPFFHEANLVLGTLCGARLTGNSAGDRLMAHGDATVPGSFDSNHIVFSGINYLYEGVTICFPVEKDAPSPFPNPEMATANWRAPALVGKLKTLATSSNGWPVISCCESSESGGRVIVDTGYTKLFSSYWRSEGQARYVVNACVYLVDVEGRFSGGKVTFSE
eukprot:TRINITY_DN4855_c0_g1_i1.p1 TRINITY_DN4855_c0_g1~~TRINITY_DN4855_c0_g1_i1.p1  ORF type:complete len:415 (-),score=64.15 TRINITY_DN4855_c0_g1_i1:181-1257(-)